MKFASDNGIDVYRVGFLYDVWFLYRRVMVRQVRQAEREAAVKDEERGSTGYWLGPWRTFLFSFRCGTVERIRQRNWRAVRNYFNGWLAEHPDGRTSAGHGWTKRVALRRLRRIRARHP